MAKSNSAAENINPYESPQSTDPRQQLGVGTWRGGELLVMHIAAELPRVCVVTGEQAAGAREWQVIWKPPGSLFSRRTMIYLPLRRDLLYRFAYMRRMSLIGLGLMAAMLLLGFAMPMLPETDWIMLLVVLIAMLMGLCGVLLWLIPYAVIEDPLRVVRSKGDYLWLAGANERFLVRLPEVPFD